MTVPWTVSASCWCLGKSPISLNKASLGRGASSWQQDLHLDFNSSFVLLFLLLLEPSIYGKQADFPYSILWCIPFELKVWTSKKEHIYLKKIK